MSVCDTSAKTRKLAEDAESAALLAAAAIGNPDGAERRRAIEDARTMTGTAARAMAHEAAQQPRGADLAAGLAVENSTRRLNAIAATLAPAD